MQVPTGPHAVQAASLADVCTNAAVVADRSGQSAASTTTVQDRGLHQWHGERLMASACPFLADGHPATGPADSTTSGAEKASASLPQISSQPKAVPVGVHPVAPTGAGPAQPARTELQPPVQTELSQSEARDTTRGTGARDESCSAGSSRVTEGSAQQPVRANSRAGAAAGASADAAGAGPAADGVTAAGAAEASKHPAENGSSTASGLLAPSPTEAVAPSPASISAAAGNGDGRQGPLAQTGELGVSGQRAAPSLVDGPEADSQPSVAEVPGYRAWVDPLKRSAVFDQLEELFQSRIAFIDGAMGTSIQKYKCDSALPGRKNALALLRRL